MPSLLVSVSRMKVLVKSGKARMGADVSMCSHNVLSKETKRLLRQLMQWFCNGGKVLHEPTVVVGQAKELLDFSAAGWCRPVSDGFCLGGIS